MYVTQKAVPGTPCDETLSATWLATKRADIMSLYSCLPANMLLPDSNVASLKVMNLTYVLCGTSDLTCFVEPHMLVMHIDAIAGRNLLACDPGGTSDPYFKVKLGRSAEESLLEKCFTMISCSSMVHATTSRYGYVHIIVRPLFENKEYSNYLCRGRFPRKRLSVEREIFHELFNVLQAFKSF